MAQAKSKIPAKVSARISAGLKKFQPILNSAKVRDLNESDTATIVTDMLAEIFGYDKFHEVTSEHQIKSTYCDLAVEIEGKLRLLIEVKAIGLELKEAHTKQAIDYAANQGVEWVALTNGINWKVYRVTFGMPIGQELVLDLDVSTLSHKTSAHVEALYLLSREGLLKAALPDYHIQLQATNRFVLGAVLLSDPVLNLVRRELSRMAPTIKIQTSDIKETLMREVLKREILEGEKAEEAQKRVKRALAAKQRPKKSSEAIAVPAVAAESPPEQPPYTGYHPQGFGPGGD